jgi:glycosyltransferase involved in cell wall biosynthesis
MTTLPHIEVVIPVFNEVDSLPFLIAELDRNRIALAGLASLSYLFINDGSSDGTTDLLRTLHRQRGDIRVIELLHNFGHSAALACGLDHFQGDIAIFMDADLQDSPAVLPQLFSEWKKGAQTVVVERTERPERLGLLFRLFYTLLRKTARHLPPINFGTHSLLDKVVVERMKLHKERHRYFPGLVAFCSASIRSIPAPRGERQYGRSRVGFMGLWHLALTAFLNSSSAPIRLVSLLGLLCALSSLGGACIIISVKLFTSWAIPGWASTLSLIFLASAIQLFCLGILGEYVARIYDEVKERPLYWIGASFEKISRSTHPPVHHPSLQQPLYR